jgi:BlaI family penicillinase repressor
MKSKSLENLGQLQRAVIEIVWELGQASVHQVRDRLDRKKKHAYTTILTAMQKLEKAGWLKHKNDGKSYIYYPVSSKEQADASSVQRFLKRVFDGDTVAMFQHLINEESLTDKELKEIRQMIDDVRKARKND